MKYFDYPYRVIYGDTDKMGFSYYGNYWSWFEGARNEYFRALDYPYTRCEEEGYYLPVIEAGIKYLGPSRYDDLLLIRVSVTDLTKTALTFEYEVFNQTTKQKITTGFTRHVFINDQKKLCRMPEEVTKIVTPFSLSQNPTEI